MKKAKVYYSQKYGIMIIQHHNSFGNTRYTIENYPNTGLTGKASQLVVDVILTFGKYTQIGYL